MTFDRLRITGHDGNDYQLGEPMYVHDDGVLLGTLDPMRVSRDGSEVLVSRFVPSPLPRNRRRDFGPLLLLEVTFFMVERFRQIQSVSYALSREIETQGDGMKVAIARSALLQSIGAEGVTVSPKPNSDTPGNFVVQGIWIYSEQNLAALQQKLADERSSYARRQVALPLSPLRNRLRQILSRGPAIGLPRGGEAAD